MREDYSVVGHRELMNSSDRNGICLNVFISRRAILNMINARKVLYTLVPSTKVY